METYPPSDPYGRLEIAGMRSALPERIQRKMAHGKIAFLHRTPNGIHDPFTHYHIVDALLRVKPDVLWKTNEFVEFLRQGYPQLSWDVTTVGRVVSDIAESLDQARPATIHRPVNVSRRWNGNHFSTSPTLESRIMLLRLMDDLYVLCEETLRLEYAGVRKGRLNTPMMDCPSVTL